MLLELARQDVMFNYPMWSNPEDDVSARPVTCRYTAGLPSDINLNFMHEDENKSVCEIKLEDGFQS